jgi:HD-GYP domain-containing protein (c-di-GMP phosphodiesterase class II)
MPKFKYEDENGGATEWPFVETLLIGRDDANDVTVSDPSVSRRHARVSHRDGYTTITDLDSRNGTFMHGVQIHESVLHNGDKVNLGGTVVFTFMDDQTGRTKPDQPLNATITDAAVQTHSILDATKAVAVQEDEISTDDSEVLRMALLRERTVSQVTDALGTLTDLQDLFDRTLDLVFHVLDADRGMVLVRDPKTGDFDVRAVKAEGAPPRASRTLLNRVCSEKVAVLSSDASADQRFEAGASIIAQNIRSVMCVPLLREGVVLGAIHVDSSARTGAFNDDDLKMLTRIGHAAAIAIQNALRLHENKTLFHQTVRSLAGAIDLRDPYTAGHSERVAAFSRATAKEMGLPTEECEQIYLSAVLHDIGKLGIRDALLRKPGRLEESEYEEFKAHPAAGARIIDAIEQMKEVTSGLAQHHEKVDGTGYPSGLHHGEISVAARIIAVADTYDAMTSDRPYRNGLPEEVALEELRKFSGHQFDPEVVDAFLKVHEKGTFTQE